MTEDTFRKVKLSPELMGLWATRDVDGNLLGWDWGEPDDELFYVPTISVNREDNLVSAERQRITELESDLEAARVESNRLYGIGQELVADIERLKSGNQSAN